MDLGAFVHFSISRGRFWPSEYRYADSRISVWYQIKILNFGKLSLLRTVMRRYQTWEIQTREGGKSSHLAHLPNRLPLSWRHLVNFLNPLILKLTNTHCRIRKVCGNFQSYVIETIVSSVDNAAQYFLGEFCLFPFPILAEDFPFSICAKENPL